MLDLTEPISSGDVRSLQRASLMALTSAGSPTWDARVRVSLGQIVSVPTSTRPAACRCREARRIAERCVALGCASFLLAPNVGRKM